MEKPHAILISYGINHKMVIKKLGIFHGDRTIELDAVGYNMI